MKTHLTLFLLFEIDQANACITRNGSLTKNFQYIDALMNRPLPANQYDMRDPHVLIHLKGHLFDSGLINQVLDIIEGLDCQFDIEECNVKPREKTTLMLRVFSAEKDKLDIVVTKVKMLCDLIETAETSMQHYDSRLKSTYTQKSDTKSKVSVLGERERNILLLGAGKVASSFAEYVGRDKLTTVTVVSQYEHDAMHVAKNATRGRAVTCDIMNSTNELRSLIQEADVVVSLLPAPMHPIIAKECISSKTDLVTASYESEEMRALRKSIEEAGISILNEVGLDPGMDHMSAMKIVDDIHSRGGDVKHFSSVCGGLPAPEAANNPLLYKFSWSPMGVITASQNSAVYRRDGEIVHVPGEFLLASSQQFDGFQSLNLEQLPNRDSLVYGDKYGIQSASTIFRGTLRYHGFSALLHVFKSMGLMNNTETGAVTWKETIEKVSKEHGFADVHCYIISCAGGEKDLASRAQRFLEWLHLNEMPVSNSSSIVRSFCDVLEQSLAYQNGERDMVLMQHDIVATFSDGSTETHSSSLQLFGDKNMTAMCKTVGYTCAIGTQLILDGVVPTKGLLLPTSKEVYIPALHLLEKEGIVFDEHIRVQYDVENVV
jgi:alpha-aminoadipic semialdehyde synthase